MGDFFDSFIRSFLMMAALLALLVGGYALGDHEERIELLEEQCVKAVE